MILVARPINKFPIFLLFIALFFYSCDKTPLKEHTINGETMGTSYRVVINSLEDKYNAIIGERGTKLSGGEKQRLSIARAVYKNPDILILDEATSSLDSESEKQVQKAINNLIKDRTVIIIAHRLSTIRNCDKIIVFDNGEIIETGSHDELIQLNNHYKKLYDLQFEIEDE